MSRPSELLTWARRLQAIAQSGLTYADDPYDAERYAAIRRIAAEMLAELLPDDSEQIAFALARESGYATPKLDVRGACFAGDRILLVRERSDGRWTLPGGWVDIHEGPRAAVEKEIREESGYHARAIKLLALWDKEQHDHPPHLFHTYKLIFLCEIIGGAATTSLETDGVAFFPRQELPPLSEQRITAAQIVRLFVLRSQPLAPTEFD